MGHEDRVARLPEDAIHLAFTSRVDNQAFRFANRPIYCTQFHPELTKDENLARFNRYLDGYAGYMSESELAQTLARFDESLEAEKLIPRFLQLVFG